MPLGRGGSRDEVSVIIDLISVVTSVGCTGHCDEGLLRNKESVLNFGFFKEGETRFPQTAPLI